jgi:hypothetical protein
MKTKLRGLIFLTISLLGFSYKTALAEVNKPYDFQMRSDLTEGLKFCTGVSILETKEISENLFPNEKTYMYLNAVLLVTPPRVKPPITDRMAKELFDGGCFNQVGRTNDDIDLKDKIMKAIETKSKHYPKNLYIEGGLVDIPFTLEYAITKDGYLLKSIY